MLNDIIFDLADRPGLKGWLFHKLGMTGHEPHVPPLVRMRQIKDTHALSAQLELWANLPTLQRVILSHGNIIANDAAEVLKRSAHELAA